MSGKRQVFLNSDARGLTLLSVAVYSLLKASDPGKPVTVFIAHDQEFLDKGCDGVLRGIVARFPFAEILFGNLTPILAEYPDLFDPRREKLMMWAFPLCERLLPPDMGGNIVYIDLDMLIRRDLGELYDMDLAAEGMVAAAVNESRRENLPYLVAAEWPEEAGYAFNNATCVVDLDQFRRDRLTDRMLDWRRRHRDVHYSDQDAQNVAYGARTKRIHPKWSYTDGWLERIVKFSPFAREWRVFPPREILEAILDPCIIHYIGPRKPTAWTHRPERRIYKRLMGELGLLENGRLPGETAPKIVLGWLFDAYHALLKLYARLLLATVCRA